MSFAAANGMDMCGNPGYYIPVLCKQGGDLSWERRREAVRSSMRLDRRVTMLVVSKGVGNRLASRERNTHKGVRDWPRQLGVKSIYAELVSLPLLLLSHGDIG
jgi:hypothetical protein